MTAYHATLGRYSVSSTASEGDRLLVSLVVELGMDGAGSCVLELSGANFAALAPAAAVAVTLDGAAVFTGAADTSACTATSQVVRAVDALGALARLEVEAAYEDVSADFIVKDLLGKAGATPGVIAKGPQLASYALHRPPRAWRHLQDLAALCGADAYTDGQGRVHVAAPKTGAADHRFTYGEDVKAIDLRAAPAAMDGIEVWGEGAASSQGADKAHWLPTKLDGVSAKASVTAGGVAEGSGERPSRVRHGALRSGEAAQDVAQAAMASAAARRVVGRIDIAGNSAVFPGDLVTIDKLPAGHAATGLLEGGPLRVRGVRHTLDRARGLVTRLAL